MFFLTEKNPATTETSKVIKDLMKIQSYTHGSIYDSNVHILG